MKLFLGLSALFFIPGSFIAFWEGIHIIVSDAIILKFLILGIILGGILYYLLLRHWNYFLTFEHELTHAFMSILFLRKINKFVVTKKDGGVVYSSGGFGGEFGNIMIVLAPYFFPTSTIIILLFQPLIPQKFHPLFIILLGITLIYHHLSTIRELKNNWNSNTFAEAESGVTRMTDIAESGFLFSFFFISTMTLFFNALIFWFLKHSYGGFFPLLKEVWIGLLTIFNFLLINVLILINSLRK